MHKLLRQGFLASCKNIPVACCKSLKALSFVSFVLPSSLRQGAGNLCSLQQVSSSSAHAVAALLCSRGSALTATSTQLCPAASRGRNSLFCCCAGCWLWVRALLWQQNPPRCCWARSPALPKLHRVGGSVAAPVPAPGISSSPRSFKLILFQYGDMHLGVGTLSAFT